jgi:prevent-host-death family protein
MGLHRFADEVDLVKDLVYDEADGLNLWMESSMQKIVNIHEAKTHLSRLLARVMGGEEVIIAKAGKPVARLVPIEQRQKERMPGTAVGQIFIAPDFDAPLPDEILQGFDG